MTAKDKLADALRDFRDDCYYISKCAENPDEIYNMVMTLAKEIVLGIMDPAKEYETDRPLTFSQWLIRCCSGAERQAALEQIDRIDEARAELKALLEGAGATDPENQRRRQERWQELNDKRNRREDTFLHNFYDNYLDAQLEDCDDDDEEIQTFGEAMEDLRQNREEVAAAC